ncbi:MAG: DEAD/DEAH box helicase [Coriobacteriales bacterium]|jgi:ATP-dependent RNA helicase RhlE|nr:DEAD/DEAH box helicase [Coriobacteriales bacterium]
MKNEFRELGLSEKMQQVITDLGYKTPTPVQEQSIPLILAGRDVGAAAQTGTGKTAAFTLPIMDKLGHRSKKSKGPLCLIVTPTRELAQQIDRVATTVGKRTNHKVLTVVGGVGYGPQTDALQRGIDILVATPGRLLDLIDRKLLRLSEVEVLVLDEADRMLDMGFWPAVRRITALVTNRKQTLLFSATLSAQVLTTAKPLLRNPEFVEISRAGTTADTVNQVIMPVDHAQKPDLLCEVLKAKGCSRVIVFTRTKSRADSCAKRLNKLGFATQAIHADRSQSQRERALIDFKKGKIDILVATDVLARGIDVSDVSHVFNYDVPTNPEDYIHRIGRTGRAGESGQAITFVGPDELSSLREIEQLLNMVIPTYDLEGFAYRETRIVPSPSRSAKKKQAPVFSGRRRGGGRYGRR